MISLTHTLAYNKFRARNGIATRIKVDRRKKFHEEEKEGERAKEGGWFATAHTNLLFEWGGGNRWRLREKLFRPREQGWLKLEIRKAAIRSKERIERGREKFASIVPVRDAKARATGVRRSTGGSLESKSSIRESDKNVLFSFSIITDYSHNIYIIYIYYSKYIL